MSPFAVSPVLHLLSAIEEAIRDRLEAADMLEEDETDFALSALLSARDWLLELRRREIEDGDS